MAQPKEKRLVTEAKMDASQAVQDGRLALVEAAAGFDAPPLGFQDDVVAALFHPGTETAAAYAAQFGPTNGKRPVGKDELAFNAKDFGAVGDGVADDTTPLNSAAAAVFAVNPDAVLYLPAGDYRISGKVTIKCALRAEAATLRYSGTGTALVIGDDTGPNIVTARRSFRLPRVINTSRGTTGWDGTSKGVLAVNLNTCELYVPFVQDFEQGLVMYGLTGGCAHNTVFLGALWENHKNLILDCTADGYTNQNLFLHGRLQQSVSKGATENDPNAAQIYAVSLNPEGGPNNNTFLNTSVEGANVALDRVDVGGSYNQFINCRWESPNNAPVRVRYRSSALHNHIQGGYGAHNIVEVFDGNARGGSIKDAFGAYTSVSTNTTAAQIIPNNVWTVINSWGTPVGRRITLDAATGQFKPRPGRWRITASVTFAPNATGRRISRISAGGSVIDITETPGNANRSSMKLDGVYNFDGAQTFAIECNQTSGADLALEFTRPYVQVQAEYLGT